MRENETASALSLLSGGNAADASTAPSSDGLGVGLEREQDGGPLVLPASLYSRLPPAYMSWEAQGAPPSEVGTDSEPANTQEDSSASGSRLVRKSRR
jgi:hypothetical protein